VLSAGARGTVHHAGSAGAERLAQPYRELFSWPGLACGQASGGDADTAPWPAAISQPEYRTMHDYWREEIAKMTQSQLIAEIANRNAEIAYRKGKLRTETDDVERFITVTWLGNAEIQQRMMYDEVIRRRKQRKEQAA
jgi:hypothetical protein